MHYLTFPQRSRTAIPIICSLVVSNFKGQHRYSFLGVWWQFITPLVMIVLYYVVFTSVRINVASDYWLLLCTGIFSYIFMESAVVSGGFCIVNHSNYIKKMSFPKQYIVYAHNVYNLIVFVITLSIIVILAQVVYHSITILIVLEITLMVGLTFIFNVGISLILSSVIVYLRDLGHLISAGSRLLFWAAPTIYTIYEVSGVLKTLLLCNPMTYYISRFQDLILYHTIVFTSDLMLCVLLSVVTLIIGHVVFCRLKDGFAERL